MKNTALVTIMFLLVFAFSDVTNSEVRVTAKQIRTLGDSLITTLAPTGVFSGMYCTNIDTLGKSNLWILYYQYFNTVYPKNSKTYYFKGEDGQISMDSSGLLLMGLSAIYDPWIDSDSAMSIAEGIGGSSIRKQYSSCVIKTRLYGWVAPPFYKEWKIEYVCPDSVRTFHIDAHSGNQILTDASANHFAPFCATLYPNYPNPFNPTTTIRYQIPVGSEVDLSIYNLLGQKIATLVAGEKKAGAYSVEWNPGGIASGVYFYKLSTTEGFTQTRKLVFLK